MKTGTQGRKLAFKKEIVGTAISALALLVLSACGKSAVMASGDNKVVAQDEQKVLDQSVFHPGQLAPQVNILAAVGGGESGTIKPPTHGTGGDGGSIPTPGS